MRAQRIEHEARVLRAFERANAPVFRHKGKPLMFRSRLPRHAHAATIRTAGEDHAREELVAFLAREDLL